MGYRCSRGHDIWTPEGVVLKRCPAYSKGVPCPGTLERVGEGSRTAKACPGSGHKVDVDPRSKKKGRCPECNKLITLTKESKLRVHEPVTS